MPRYTFECGGKSHDETRRGPRKFERAINHSEGKRIDQYRCDCGATAKRDLTGDLATVSPIGMTPISHSSSAKGTLGRETEFSFGRFKINPDGIAEKNHRPFRDTGEMNRYMNGANDLGAPKIGDDGKPLRRRDGSFVRGGAELFKYGPNATPSRDGVRRRRFVPPRSVVVDSGWVGDVPEARGGGTMRREEFAKHEIPAHPYVSPKRGEK